MNDRPFLSIITRTCKRPKALAICKKALTKQHDQDFEHVVIVDEIGRGVPWANGMLAERDWSDLKGEYVYILDDDNLMFHGAVKALHEQADGHDMLICRIDRLRSDQRLLPEPEYWQLKPVKGHIDVGCVVLRRDFFLRMVKNYTASYEGDFDYISSAFEQARSVKWVDYKIMKVQRISAGSTEQ